MVTSKHLSRDKGWSGNRQENKPRYRKINWSGSGNGELVLQGRRSRCRVKGTKSEQDK